MIRTQVYLDNADKNAIERIHSKTGESQSEIIRQAIKSYIKDQQFLFNKAAFGIWKDNNLDFASLRKECDRDN